MLVLKKVLAVWDDFFTHWIDGALAFGLYTLIIAAQGFIIAAVIIFTLFVFGYEVPDKHYITLILLCGFVMGPYSLSKYAKVKL